MNGPRTLDEELAHLLKGAGEAAGFFSDQVELSALAGDGSERRFFRVRQGSTHAVALISPRQKHHGIDENDSYFLIGNHLFRRNVPVPRIYWADPAQGYFLLEDLGDCHLQTLVNRRRCSLIPAYYRVVQFLVDMQRRAREGFDTGYCFDTVVYNSAFVYQRELEYFRERFLNDFLGLDIGPEDLRHDFENIAETAGVTTLSHVIHRDFQSRNLMICAQRLRLVDFQGMRFGPPAYDLASLLLDPYVRIPPELERKAVALYWSQARGHGDGSFQGFMKSYRTLRLCRNLQVLGAYSNLGLIKGKTAFLRYIPRAWRQLCYWINHHGGGQYRQLQRLVNRIDRTGPMSIRSHAIAQVFRDKQAAT